MRPTDWPTQLLALLAALAGVLVTGAAAEPEPARLIILVRSGRLSRDEVSPGSKGAAEAAWRVVETGTTVGTLEPPPPEARTPSGLRARLVSEATRTKLAGAGIRLVELELPDGESVRAALAPRPAAPPSIRRLEALFGAPPEPSDEEQRAVRALKLSLGAEPAAPSTSPLRTQSLEAVEKARVAIVRVASTADSEDEVRARDRLLGRLAAMAGDEGVLLVVSIPEGGDASLLLRGPAIRVGIVVGERRPFATVAALSDAILGRLLRKPPATPSARSEETAQAREEIDAILR